VEEGDRIAQLILERIYTPEVEEVDVSTFKSSFTSNADERFRTSMKLSAVQTASDLREVMGQMPLFSLPKFDYH
jgi:hypothetical protein